LAATLLGADAFHNTADGAAIAASFLVSFRLGVITAVAVVVHEVPEELADYVLVRNAGLTRARALLAMTAVQLTAAIGAAVTLLWATAWRHVSGVVLAVAAGTFLYIALVDLMPSVLRSEPGRGQRRAEAVAGLLAGLALTIFESFW
jgi:zinc and cadmium transporter